MNPHTIVSTAAVQAFDLAALVDRASTTLMGARSHAEILQARTEAGFAYDSAKRLARVAAAQHAHDDLIAAVLRSQADAAEIEAGAKRRLADEYTEAQSRGEVAAAGDSLRRGPAVPDGNGGKPSSADLGISRKDIHAGRLVRAAEEASPGVVRRALYEMLERGEEPSKANLSRVLSDTVGRSVPKPKREPGASFLRFLELADELEALTAADLIADAGPQRAKLGQRASTIAGLCDDIMEGCSL